MGGIGSGSCGELLVASDQFDVVGGGDNALCIMWLGNKTTMESLKQSELFILMMFIYLHLSFFIIDLVCNP